MEVAGTTAPNNIAEGTSKAFSNPLAKVPIAPMRGVNEGAAQDPAPKDPATPADPAPKETAAPATPATPAAPTFNIDDLTDDQINELIAKKTKGKVKTLAELNEEQPPVKTKAELEKEEEEERAQALAWSISQGKIKKEDYDKAITDQSKSKRDIALSILTSQWMENDKTLTPEDCQELFKDMFFEGEKDDTPKRKAAIKQMDSIADNYLKQYSDLSMDKIHEGYRTYKTSESNKSAISKKVDTVFDSIASELKLTSKIEDTDVEIPFSLDAAELKAIKKASKATILEQCAAKGIDPSKLKDSEIQDVINYDIKAKYFDKAVAHATSEGYKKGALDKEAAFKNIPVREADTMAWMAKPADARATHVSEGTKKAFR